MSKYKKLQQMKQRKKRTLRDRLSLQQAMRAVGSGSMDFYGQSAHLAVMEITEESSEMDPPLTPEGNDKASRAIELAHEQKYKEAIDLLSEVNVREPGRPPIIYNLASFRHLLDEKGTKEEYDETIDMLVRDFPDYFFGQTAYATRLIAQDRLDEARDILLPLYQSQRLHITEFKALSSAVIAYFLADGDEERAGQAHQAAVKVCGEDGFPSMESFHIRLLINRLSRTTEKNKKRGATKKTVKNRKGE